MGKNNFRVSVNLVLTKEDKVLLTRRCNTGWNDGKYALMGGHVEDGENPLNAVVREADEELGIVVSEENLEHLLTMPVYPDHIYLYFGCSKYDGTPINNEPSQCDDVRFVSINKLTEEDIIDADKLALQKIFSKETNFETFGYKK